jgi:hypothetical protein
MLGSDDIPPAFRDALAAGAESRHNGDTLSAADRPMQAASMS